MLRAAASAAHYSPATAQRLLLLRACAWLGQPQQEPVVSSGARAACLSTSASSSSAEMHGTTVLAVRHRGSVVIVADGQISMGSKVVKPNARKLRRLLPRAAPAGAATTTTTTTTAPGTTIDAAAAEDAASLPGGGLVIGGFAGSTADGITLFERLEARLRQHPGQLRRAAVDLAKAWRQDRVLRRLRAAMLVADATGACLEISGNGDVLEPADGVHAIGSGARYALAAARALVRLDEDAAAAAAAGVGAGAPADAAADAAAAGEQKKQQQGGGLFTALDIAQRAMRVASDRCVYTNDVWSWEGIDERTGEAFSGGSGGGGGGGGSDEGAGGGSGVKAAG